MPTTMTEPKLQRVSLAQFTTDNERDLSSLATPGQVTLLAELVYTGNKDTSTARLVAFDFIRRFSKAGKEVCVLADNNSHWLATRLQDSGADCVTVFHNPVENKIDANDIIAAAESPELFVVLMPENLNQSEVEDYFTAAAQVASTGAAVIVVCRISGPNTTGTPAVFDFAGASVDNIFNRVWIIQSKESAINVSRCNYLSPLSDPVAEQGYTFAITGNRVAYELQNRAKNARQATHLILPQIHLAIGTSSIA